MPVKVFGPPGASTGSGSVGGPATSTDNAIARFDGTDGKTIQNSLATVDDSGNLTANNYSANSSGVIRIGQSAGNGTMTGAHNLIAGSSAGASITTSANNVLLGRNAGFGLLSGNGINVAIGFNAGVSLTTAEQSTFVGRDAGRGVTTGIANTAIGESAGYKLTTGMDNTFVGSDAGYSGNETGGITTGSHNTCVGNNAGESGAGPTFDDVTGSDNTAIGHGAGWSGATASFQTAIGSGAKCTADNQVTLGRAADSLNIPGTGNVSVAKKFTVTAATLAGIGGDTIAETLFTLPARGKITGVCVKTSTAFDLGGGTATVTIGVAGAESTFAGSYNLITAVASDNFLDADQFKSTDFAATDVIGNFQTNIDWGAAVAGSVDIWISYVVLPA